MNLPKHLAIIMDGNGRWAKARGHSRLYGHIRGARIAKQTIEECARLGVQNLTLFTFSTENWLRPQEEVSFLMSLLFRRLRKEKSGLAANNIRFHCIGQIERLPLDVRRVVFETMESTAHCTGMNLVFALSYGGRQEITEAVRFIAQQVQDGHLRPDEIDEAVFASQLPSSFLPDPDLIVRTSGEFRISNFYLWQAAYSELYMCERPWPEFSTEELHKALQFYSRRERRFGRTSEQVHPKPAELSR